MQNPLYPHQTEAIKCAVDVLTRSRGFYVQHDPGMGKTLTAIITARMLNVERILIVCPLVAIGVWDRELTRWWPTLPRDRVFIVNYDRLVSGKAADKLMLKLEASEPDLLILDEAQYVKSPTAQRTHAVTRLAHRSRYKLLLSGTPAHSPLDWWAQFRIIAPDEPMWAQRYRTYKERVCILGGPQGNWIKGYRERAKQEAVRAMAPYVHHAESRLLNLPDPVESVVPVTLSTKERAHYAEMEADLRTDVTDVTEANAEIVLTQMLRLTQIAAGHVTDENGTVVDVGDSKLKACLALLDERDHEKVVIACRFKRDIARIEKELIKRKRPYYVISGSVSGPQRTVAENSFQRMPQEAGTVMLLQYQAGGVAITLSEAKALIFYTLDPSVIRYKQMIGRVWRIGQTGHVQILTLIAEQTQDEAMYDALRTGLSHVDMARLLVQTLGGTHAPGARR